MVVMDSQTYCCVVFYTDINECAEDSDGCAHNCNNTLGSYICYCDVGYNSSGRDGRSCNGRSSLIRGLKLIYHLI